MQTKCEKYGEKYSYSWYTYQLLAPMVITGLRRGISIHAKDPKQLPSEISAPLPAHAAAGSSLLLVSEVDILQWRKRS